MLKWNANEDNILHFSVKSNENLVNHTVNSGPEAKIFNIGLKQNIFQVDGSINSALGLSLTVPDANLINNISNGVSVTLLHHINPENVKNEIFVTGEYAQKLKTWAIYIEGIYNYTYNDNATTPHPTIGVGHNFDASDSVSDFASIGISTQRRQSIKLGNDTMTDAEVNSLFQRDIGQAQKYLKDTLGKNKGGIDYIDLLSLNQKVALVVLTHNLPSLIGTDLVNAVKYGIDNPIDSRRWDKALQEIVEYLNVARDPTVAIRRLKDAAMFITNTADSDGGTYDATEIRLPWREYIDLRVNGHIAEIAGVMYSHAVDRFEDKFAGNEIYASHFNADAYIGSGHGADDKSHFGTTGDDKISGGIGNELLFGGNGKDVIIGGAGNDYLGGNTGDDVLEGGVGQDYLHGGDGQDTASYEHSAVAVKINLQTHQYSGGDATGDDYKSIENITGSGLGDTLTGDDGPNRLNGGGGNDRLVGGGGNDTLIGGGGTDTLDGQADEDTYEMQSAGPGNAAGNGKLIISDSDGTGVLALGGAVFTRTLDKNPDTQTWTDGDYTFTPGSGLRISGGGLDVSITNWKPTRYGITLNDAPEKQAQKDLEDALKQPLSRRIDPIVLDMNRDSTIELIPRDSGNVYFDMDGDDIKELTGWVRKTEGLLAIDVDKNGTIDSIKELIGDLGHSGFTELATYDSNHDTIIDARDNIFSDLRVWIDADEDALTDAGELLTMAQAGVKAIDLNFTLARVEIDGNLIHEKSVFEWTDGSAPGKVVDAWFDVSNVATSAEVSATGNPAIDALPDIRGYGDVESLHAVMLDNAVLTAEVKALMDRSLSDTDGLRAQIERILYLWAGTEDFAIDSRGAFFDGRKLETLEAFMGTLFFANGTANPGQLAAPFLVSAWENFYKAIMARLMLSTELGDILAPASDFLPIADELTTYDSPEDLFARLQAGLPTTSTLDRAAFWAGAVPLAQVIIKDSGVDTDTGAYRALVNDALRPYGLGGFASIIGNGFTAVASGTSILSANGLYRAGSGADTLYLTGAVQAAYGQDGDDRIIATNIVPSSIMSIDGGSGNDTLQGGGGSDWIDGGLGTDLMAGGAGSDTYIVEDAGDRVVEGAVAGADLVRASVNYALGDNLENLTLTGAAALNGAGNRGDNILIGNDGNNALRGFEGNDVLDGGAGIDRLYGGAGADTYYLDNAGDRIAEEGAGTDLVYTPFDYTLANKLENLVLTGTAIRGYGNELNNSITGNAEANILNGLAGGDAMFGLAGDDTYYVDDLDDRVYEAVDAGLDTVRATVSFTLGSNIENLILTGTLDIDAVGNNLANSLSGTIGDNRLNGGIGADRMAGVGGDDTYVIDNDGDVVIESLNGGTDTVETTLVDYTLADGLENLVLLALATLTSNGTGNAADNNLRGTNGANSLTGLAGNDTLSGFNGTDTLLGGLGNDLMDGGLAADQMTGDLGNDTYIIDNLGDVVTEAAGGGVDTVQSSITWALAADFENLTLTGTGAVDGTGNAAVNNLTGNTAANRLDGGAGNDVLAGGAGNDTYIIDAGDTVVEALGAGIDTVIATFNYTLNEALENLTLTGNAILTGNGNALANTLIGNDGANLLRGFDGNDVLDGGLGADTLLGGQGSDIYYVDAAGDVILEEGTGTDKVFSAVDYVLGSKVERLELTGDAIKATGNDLANVIIGNAASNLIDGGGGADQLAGGLGDDTFIVDNAGDKVSEGANAGNDLVRSSVSFALGSNVENLGLTGAADINGAGNALNNVIVGNSGDNRLDGLTGADTLAGGLGDDTYVVDNVGDVVTELANGGIDTVTASLAGLYVLADVLENLILYTGTIDVVARDGTGNAQANLLRGNHGANVLSGLDGDDLLFGLNGNDTLNGGLGNDSLDGGAGEDVMNGGAGNDTYLVTSAADVVTETADGGIDTIISGVTISLGNFAANVENVTLVGAGSIHAAGNTGSNTLTGNSGNNNLDGGAGADVLTGGAGNDTYDVDNAGDQVIEAPDDGIDLIRSTVTMLLGIGVENGQLLGTGATDLTGNELANRLDGNGGGNRLDGSLGADTMAGGGGNDTYVIDAAGDQVVENLDSGTDLILSQLSSWTLGDNFENLTLIGALNGNAIGNALANVLTGNSGNNALNGAAGADIARGGLGNDTYLVDNAADTVIELDGEGTDLVRSAVTFSLAGNFVENLELTGGIAADLTGNALANSLKGNAGINILNGAAGNDSLTGGNGADRFVFGLASGQDTVTDFSAAQNDTIDLNAYSNGVTGGGGITLIQDGASTLINLGTGNAITVLNAAVADVSAHIAW